MNKDNFLNMVRERVMIEMPESNAEITSVTKNNGVVYHGIRISNKDGNLCPVIYLDEPYEHFCEGDETIDDIVHHIISVGRSTPLSFPEDNIRNYEEAKNRLCIKLINAPRNEEMLRHTPHLVFGDLAAIFQIQLDFFSPGRATTTITDNIIKMWKNVDVNTLFMDAVNNCKKDVLIRSIGSILASHMGFIPDISDTGEQMYVLTNNEMSNGACQMLFPENLDLIAEKLGTRKVFIIPSSIHECIVVPVDTQNIDVLTQMISEVNEAEVADEDILSETLYMYDADHREYSIAQSGRRCFMSAAA